MMTNATVSVWELALISADLGLLPDCVLSSGIR